MKNLKKLTLNKESVRNLNIEETKEVVGANLNNGLYTGLCLTRVCTMHWTCSPF